MATYDLRFDETTRPVLGDWLDLRCYLLRDGEPIQFVVVRVDGLSLATHNADVSDPALHRQLGEDPFVRWTIEEALRDEVIPSDRPTTAFVVEVSATNTLTGTSPLRPGDALLTIER